VRILALIAARGGSQRLPGKNLRPLGGRPLLVWSINAASGVPDICDILVSTDSAAIAEVARDAGALAPWLRPAALATDDASSAAVAVHALDWYEQARGPVDGLLLLQPTSPFRTRQTVLRGCELFGEHHGRSVIAVSPAKSHPMSCFRVEAGMMRPFMSGGDVRSQDLPPAFVVNGALYLISPERLRAQRSFYGDATVPLIIDDPAQGIDIDTEWDWRLAEAVLAVSGSKTDGA
jgi:CMP-N,N'-diacetyllegionaminic acid synthase